jgi:hypothetical protein
MTRLQQQSRARASLHRASASAIVLVCGLGGCGDKTMGIDAKVIEAGSVMRAGAGGPYVQPRNPCDVVDLSPLGDVGRSASRATETEGDGRQITGCVIDLDASDATNRFKLFVSVDSEPEARFAVFEQAWTSDTVVGYVAERVDGIGTKSIYAGRLSADGLHIDTVLGVLDQNLYVEARFTGGGNSGWNSAGMRDGLVGVVGAAMTMLAD